MSFKFCYRVVYPEDVDLQQPSSPTEKNGGQSGPSSVSPKNSSRPKGRRGRPVRGRRTKQPGTDKNTRKEERGRVPVDSSTLQESENNEDVELKEDSTPVEEVPKVCKCI